MKRIVAYVRPHRLEDVQTAVAALGITGLTVADVRGAGVGPETSAWGGGVVALPIRARLTVILEDGLVEPAIAAIVENARTGEPGDGKIFVEPMEDAIRIRTGERAPEGL